MRKANLVHQKTLEDFDFRFNPQVPKAKVLALATCALVERRESALLMGQTGVGKSHVAQALGHRACRRAAACFQQLHAGRADNSHHKRLVRLAEFDLLIINDLGPRWAEL